MRNKSFYHSVKTGQLDRRKRAGNIGLQFESKGHMSNVTLDFTINLPILGGGMVFLITVGHQLGKIAQKLEYFTDWHNVTSEKVDKLSGRVSRIEGHLDLDK